MIIKEAKKEYVRVGLLNQDEELMSIEEWENEVINHINCFTISRLFLNGIYIKRFKLNDVTWYIERTYKL